MFKNSAIKIFGFFLVFCLCTLSHAESTKVVTLKDGSSIRGVVLEMSNGVYTIETSNLGTIQVNESDIVGITSGQLPTAGQDQNLDLGNAQFNGQIQALQSTIMQDPKMMMEIQDLIQDEEIQRILKDPDFVNDIMSKDLDRIQSNSKTDVLMDNPKIQRLIEMIQGSQR